MNPKNQLKIAIFLLLAVTASCAPLGKPAATVTPQAPRPATPATESAETSGRDRLYSDSFDLRFEGDSAWGYQLRTRNAKGLREMQLHIEGVSAQNNPGDIRLVTDGVTTWMIGEGTDQACIQFPNHQGLDPSFIVPETLFPLESAQNLLETVAEEEIAGKKTLHYSGKNVTQGVWRDASIDVWQDSLSKNIARFSMQAAGEDPFFGAGAGTLWASYAAVDWVEGSIEPVPGCEISAPLPKTAEMFVRLPDMASFETVASPAEMVSFYQEALPQHGWTEAESPAEDAETVVLSYRREAEEVEVRIEARSGGGSKVKLLFVR